VNRAILEACLPCVLVLAASFVLLRAVMQLSGARLHLSRLKRLHRCQQGAVQSLSFVLTLPIFVVLVMFIVQVSQLMIGIMTVNYAAYAATRAASVWFPAHSRITGYHHEGEDNLPPPIRETSTLHLQYFDSLVADSDIQDQREIQLSDSSYKYQKVFVAAVLACAPISPSRDLGHQLQGDAARVPDVVNALYRTMVPDSQINARIPHRIQNKIAYSYWNTELLIGFTDKNTRQGPSYNPRLPVRLPNGELIRVWDPHEVGWQDPVTITVYHHFALLPGPGRFLAKYIVRESGQSDLVSPHIQSRPDRNPSEVYTTPIVASATMTNEGFKPVLSYEQSHY